MVGCWLQFSDGSRTPLDLYDPSGYFLSVASLDPRVVSVRSTPGSAFVVVAEAEGQGLLLRAELAICEACQKSKRKSKLAVGGGTVRVEFPLDEQLAGTGKKETSAAGGDEEKDLIFTSPLNRFQPAGIHESTTSGIKLATTFKIQEAMGGGVSTIKSINSVEKTPITKPVADKALRTVDPRSLNDYGNRMENSDFPFQVDQPKQEPPLVESDLIQMFNVFADIEVCIYALVGVSCLAVIAVLLNCATHNVKSRKKSPVQCQAPSEHKHHWVRVGTAAEQTKAAPIATTCKQEMPTAVEMPRTNQMQKSTERSRGTEMIPSRDIPPGVPEERTATLGRRTNTLPLRRDPMAFRSATLLPKPVRSEPLHSPTSKRNQVQFTTFTTLDIKHLAALKKSAQSFSWANQVVGGSQGNGIGPSGQLEGTNHVNVCSQVEGSVPTVDSGESRGFLPEGPWPVAKPVSKV